MSGSLTGPGNGRPNVVIIVLDAARADTVRAMSRGPAPQLPFINWLAKQAASFPRTVCPAAWSIPSHASLFTGWNPWEHNTHYRWSLRLNPRIPTLAGTLRNTGYATFLDSANGFLSPPTGLLNGFNSAAWGESWERLFRISGKSLPSSGINCGPTQADPIASRLAVLPELSFRGFSPIAMDAANYFVSRVRDPSVEYNPTIAPWVEPTLERWLGQQDPKSPAFVYVNLYDAHEPYFLPPDLRREPGTWGKFARSRVDGTGILAGDSALNPETCEVLYRVYRSVLIQLDRRVQTLVEILRRTGRWENTLFIVTSDHGQCFGEHDYLFHERRVWEPIARVPLYVRFPYGQYGGVESSSWASLLDVFPTVLEVTGASAMSPLSGYSLGNLLTAPRPEPAWTIADGIYRTDRSIKSYGSRERANYWDHVLVAGYYGSTKLILDATSGQCEYYDIERDPAESVRLSYSPGNGATDLLSKAQVYGQKLLRAPPSNPSEEVN
jgi:arylsulfatase A-like enzyme